MVIDSSALSIVTDRYCATDDPKLLTRAYEKIKESTLVVFGGAPVFNYAYQWFFKKTATILRIAKELGKPVIFSAIGIDSYEEQNERCQLLKSALHNGCVVQATTRDGIEHLRRYASPSIKHVDADQIENQTRSQTTTHANTHNETSKELTTTNFPVALVSDPAVFTKTVFANSNTILRSDTPNDTLTGSTPPKGKIGLFVIRAAAFKDNKIFFPREQIVPMWRDLCQELEARNYDYELLTSGHFADEAYLGELIDTGMIPASKCVRNLNTPEALLERIRSYDGVVSCRLHPSIISFSYDVPSVSLVWNSKVTDFYRHIGYPWRAISVESLLSSQSHSDTHGQDAALLTESIDVAPIVDALEQALTAGVNKNNEYLESVYATLVDGLAAALGIPANQYQSFTGQQLLDSLSTYPGTTVEMERDKTAKKFTRCYRKYIDTQTDLRDLRAGKLRYRIRYHSGGIPNQVKIENFDLSSGSIQYLSSGNVEYLFPVLVSNRVQTNFSACGFTRAGKTFVGWKARFRIGDNWFWCLKDGGLIPRTPGSIKQAALFAPGEPIPTLPVRRIDVMVAEAVWRGDSFRIHYNSGRSSGKCHVAYNTTDGTIRHLKSGSVEFSPTNSIPTGTTVQLLPNQFSYPGLVFTGWRMRIKQQGKWYWHCQNGKLAPKQNYNRQTDGSLYIFKNQETLPALADVDAETIVLEATWKPKTSLPRKLLQRTKTPKPSR